MTNSVTKSDKGTLAKTFFNRIKVFVFIVTAIASVITIYILFFLKQELDPHEAKAITPLEGYLLAHLVGIPAFIIGTIIKYYLGSNSFIKIKSKSRWFMLVLFNGLCAPSMSILIAIVTAKAGVLSPLAIAISGEVINLSIFALIWHYTVVLKR